MRSFSAAIILWDAFGSSVDPLIVGEPPVACYWRRHKRPVHNMLQCLPFVLPLGKRLRAKIANDEEHPPHCHPHHLIHTSMRTSEVPR